MDELTQKEIKDKLRNLDNLSTEEIKELLRLQLKLHKSAGLPKKEVDAMLRKTPKERYIYSVKRIAQEEEAWTLKNKDGIIATGDDDGNTFLPVWPNKEYALKCMAGEWKNCELKKLPLDNLIKEILPNLSKEGTKVSVFIVPDDPVSVTATADDFLNNLLYECSQYE